jgi:uncharacterized membrane protein YkgB
LGSVELLIELLTLVGVALRGLGLLGASLAFITSFITLLFLITTLTHGSPRSVMLNMASLIYQEEAALS